ncbi:early nodulin-like protein 2 [Punica granatum]|uniref:Early nodulin-like protein 2 n=1 Tax=Punica granatum TaxID=22663 RepID=A0A218X2U1_PUNGR|nr:early nodulin-like protein 2 [Punica granatum]OWM78662.1 hypothetical protein CDL15_Pgr002833 [Punica granatum]
MGSRASVGLILVAVTGFLCSSDAYVFAVGGKDGWVRQPSEGYNQWAGRYRFQINDSLLFKYKKGADSVLVVTKDGYASCNTKSPLVSLTDGDSLFTFKRSGPFFFISGNPENCNNGQKLIVVVLAPRTKAPTPQPPSSPPPAIPPMSPPGGHMPPPPPSGMVPPPGVPSPASPPAEPGTNPSGSNPVGPQAPAPSPSFAQKGSSCSGAMVLGFSGLVSYLVLGKVLV